MNHPKIRTQRTVSITNSETKEPVLLTRFRVREIRFRVSLGYYGNLGKALKPIIRQVVSELPKKDDASEDDDD